MRAAWCRRRRSEDTPPPMAASYVLASSNCGRRTVSQPSAGYKAMMRPLPALGVNRRFFTVQSDTLWNSPVFARNFQPLSKTCTFPLPLASMLRTSSSSPGAGTVKATYESPLVRTFISPLLTVWLADPQIPLRKPGEGKRLILCIRILLVETVEHILRDQFHGRRELTGQDCDLLVECADLLCELVDDGVRVGWNLSQNKSP